MLAKNKGGKLDTEETNVKPRSNNSTNFKSSTLFMCLLMLAGYLFFVLDIVEAQEKSIFLNINGLTTNYSTTHKNVGDLINEIYPDQKNILSIFPDINKEILPGDTIFIKIQAVKPNKTIALNLEAAKQESKIAEKKEKIAAIKKAEPEIDLSIQPKSPLYQGTATWYKYGDKPTTASTIFPKGTKLRVTAINSGKIVDVVVNDYGPEAWTGVTLDLNSIAFAKLAPLGAGKIFIEFFVI